MSEDLIYALPDLTNKVRHGRGRMEVEMEERGEREERIVDIYVSAGDLDPGTQQNAVQRNTAQEQHGDSDETKKNHSRMAAGCLVLLCVLLLGSIVGLVIHYFEKIKEKNINLTLERDDLQSSLDELQTTYNNLIERDDIKRVLCESHGFTLFDGLCYDISTERNNWEDSRQYCRNKQSDLIVINSKEKQDFVNSLNQRVWLGLTDTKEEGRFVWVDNTPLTTPTFWYHPNPDNNGAPPNTEEDCVEFNHGWNDRSCSDTIQWICEGDIY